MRYGSAVRWWRCVERRSPRVWARASLTNCGLPELIATTLDDYETLAYAPSDDDTLYA